MSDKIKGYTDPDERRKDRENLEFYLGETQRGLEAEHLIKLVQDYRTKYPRDSFADEVSFKYITWLAFKYVT